MRYGIRRGEHSRVTGIDEVERWNVVDKDAHHLRRTVARDDQSIQLILQEGLRTAADRIEIESGSGNV